MNAKQNVPAASQPNVRWILVWGSVLVVAVLAFVWNLFVIMRDTNRDAGYRELVGNLRVLSQQIEANAREAVDGDAAAFTNLESARADFGRTLDDLANGTDALPSPREALAEELALIGETWSVVDPAAATIVARKESIEFLSKTSATLAGSIEDV
jgi:twitching motility protein PilJ